MEKIKVGIIGCGAIGSSLAKSIKDDFSDVMKVTALYDKEYIKAKTVSDRVFAKNTKVVKELDTLIERSCLVIEASCAQSAWDITQKVISKGRDIMIMSVGGVALHIKELTQLALARHCKVYLPSGAICGIDALKAAKVSRIKSVVLTTRKHPDSFKGVAYVQDKKINLKKIRKDTVLFSGKASSAIRYFPQNINVAAVLSIAGIGLEKTQVKIIVSPFVKRNIHEISIETTAGSIFTRTENVLHPKNPKTSYLAVLSALATLRQIASPVKIGT